ncbi:dethiobiotin synthase [soil metagenome]
MRAFVTGTDTGTGKTYFSCLLLRALRAGGQPAAGYKPVVCGDRDDAAALQAAGEPGIDLEAINPVWLKTPASPMAAALIENREIDPGALVAGYHALADRFPSVIVEGAGGWEVPISAEYSLADLAVALELPVLVVVDNKLGALNHTLLTVNAIAARGLDCAGLILNSVSDERDSASISNRALLGQLLPDVPVLVELMHGETSIALPL